MQKVKPAKDFLNQEDFCKRFLESEKFGQISSILLNVKFILFLEKFKQLFSIAKI